MKQLCVLPVAVAVAGLAVAGCGSSSTPPAAPAQTTESDSAAMPSVTPATGSPNATTVVTVSISAGVVTPTNAEEQAVAGQPIVLEVNSDAPDSIHVHSVPAHVFDVAARPGQRFEFTVDVPGRVDVELHNLNRTILTLTVRPR